MPHGRFGQDTLQQRVFCFLSTQIGRKYFFERAIIYNSVQWNQLCINYFIIISFGIWDFHVVDQQYCLNTWTFSQWMAHLDLKKFFFFLGAPASFFNHSQWGATLPLWFCNFSERQRWLHHWTPLFLFPGLSDNIHRISVLCGLYHHPHPPCSDVPMSIQTKQMVNCEGAVSIIEQWLLQYLL